MKENDFEWLLSWYHTYCDGDWEEGFLAEIRNYNRCTHLSNREIANE